MFNTFSTVSYFCYVLFPDFLLTTLGVKLLVGPLFFWALTLVVFTYFRGCIVAFCNYPVFNRIISNLGSKLNYVTGGLILYTISHVSYTSGLTEPMTYGVFLAPLVKAYLQNPIQDQVFGFRADTAADILEGKIFK